MRALSIAATGMTAQQLNVEVIANNVANINTTGFKRSRAEFTDLIYQAERLQGVPTRGGEAVIPEGAQVGLGARLAAIRALMMQGPLASTGNKLDLALSGRGWFQILGPNDEILYTRAGAFSTNGDGLLVTPNGDAVEPQITVPQNTRDIRVNESGEVFAFVDNQTDPQLIGQLQLANFANEAGLEPLGDNLFRETTASGAPVVGDPQEPGFARVLQGYLEDSNVDPVKEITELISAQRAYEMNSKVIQAADDMFATVTKGIR